MLRINDLPCGVECRAGRVTFSSSASPGAEAANISFSAAVDFRPRLGAGLRQAEACIQVEGTDCHCRLQTDR